MRVAALLLACLPLPALAQGAPMTPAPPAWLLPDRPPAAPSPPAPRPEQATLRTA